MNIVHVCLSCFYIDGFNYQENELVRQHVADGHNVHVIASTENKSSSGRLIYSKPGTYQGTDRAPVTRLSYRLWPHKIAKKLRVHSGVYELLSNLRPDAILFHGCCGWEITTVARYARDNPKVLFYIDSHEDQHNSARSFLSREILHKLFYRKCLQRALPFARKVLCVSLETMDFVEQTYGVPRDQLEFYPLGGRPIPNDEYEVRRARGRAKVGIRSGILVVQSGHQTARKNLLASLRCFQRHGNALLAVAGSLADDIKEEATALIDKSDSIVFVGWQSSDELTDLLCAADIYLQPGTQSATMQHSLCCHCAVILDDVPSHKPFVDGNGWLLSDAASLPTALAEAERIDLRPMQERSFAIAKDLLDYAKLSTRVLR